MLQNFPHLPSIEQLHGNKHLAHYEMDCLAKSLVPSDSPLEKAKCFPVYTIGDGQCFPRSLSRLVCGDESRAVEMRVRLVVEGVKNIEHYLNKDILNRGHETPYGDSVNLVEIYRQYGSDDIQRFRGRESYQHELLNLCRESEWCGVWQLHQASSVLGCRVYSMFPHTRIPVVRQDLNRWILPVEDCVDNVAVIIMWTKSSPTSGFNHFVPVVMYVFVDICLLFKFWCNVDMLVVWFAKQNKMACSLIDICFCYRQRDGITFRKKNVFDGIEGME